MNEQPDEVAQQVLTRPSFREPLFQESVAQLEHGFRSPDYVGPDGYASELLPDLGPGDEAYERARNEAYARVSAVVGILKENLWSSVDQ